MTKKKRGFSDMMNTIKQEMSSSEREDTVKKTNEINYKENKEKTKSIFGIEKSSSKKPETLSVKFTSYVNNVLDTETKFTNKSTSSIITEILLNIYDDESKTFKVDIPKNEVIEKRMTTITLPKNLKTALIKESEKHNMKAYEYLNKIIESLIKE